MSRLPEAANEDAAIDGDHELDALLEESERRRLAPRISYAPPPTTCLPPKPRSQWWRWPLMPAAALVGGVAASFLVELGQCMFAGPDGWWGLYITPVIAVGAFGYAYASIACHVAPSGKMIAGVVMATLMAVAVVFLVVMAWVLPDNPLDRAILATVAGVAYLLGAVGALVNYADESRWGF